MTTQKRPEPRSVDGKFKRDVRLLRKLVPPILPVRAYRRVIPNHKKLVGYCELRYDDDGQPSHFVVAVERRLSWQATWQILLHEWAHALAWHEGHKTVEDHGPEWALALAKCYQETVER